MLVHSGGVHGGHYYAFIKPNGKQWFKFDDEKARWHTRCLHSSALLKLVVHGDLASILVTIVACALLQVSVEDVKKALNEQYGGEDENSPPGTGFNTFKFTKYSNAYMLVYVRTSHWDKVRPQSPHMPTQTLLVAFLPEECCQRVARRRSLCCCHYKGCSYCGWYWLWAANGVGHDMGVLAGCIQIMCDVGKNDIQEHVRLRLEAEKEEKEQRRREKQEAHLYTVFRIVTDQDLRDQIGQTRWFDLADQDKVTLRRARHELGHQRCSGGDPVLCLDLTARECGAIRSLLPNHHCSGLGSLESFRSQVQRVLTFAVQVKTFRVKKQMLFGDFRGLVAKELGVPLEQQRFWTFARRQNNTLRCGALSLSLLVALPLFYCGLPAIGALLAHSEHAAGVAAEGQLCGWAQASKGAVAIGG